MTFHGFGVKSPDRHLLRSGLFFWPEEELSTSNAQAWPAVWHRYLTMMVAAGQDGNERRSSKGLIRPHRWPRAPPGPRTRRRRLKWRDGCRACWLDGGVPARHQTQQWPMPTWLEQILRPLPVAESVADTLANSNPTAPTPNPSLPLQARSFRLWRSKVVQIGMGPWRLSTCLGEVCTGA